VSYDKGGGGEGRGEPGWTRHQEGEVRGGVGVGGSHFVSGRMVWGGGCGSAGEAGHGGTKRHRALEEK